MCVHFLTVKHFSEAFLLTYYTFITPEELITKLLYRYARRVDFVSDKVPCNITLCPHRLDSFYKSGVAAIWQATISLLVRVLTGLK